MNVACKVKIFVCVVVIVAMSSSAGAEIRVFDSSSLSNYLGIFIDEDSFYCDLQDAFVFLDGDGDVVALEVYYGGGDCTGSAYVKKGFLDPLKQIFKNSSTYYRSIGTMLGLTEYRSYMDTEGFCYDIPAGPSADKLYVDAVPVVESTQDFTIPVALPLVPSYSEPDTGPQGPQGVICWDLDSDGGCDLPDEDRNDDGVCDVNDCRDVRAVVVPLQ